MSALTSGKLKCMFYIYIYIYFFEKQVKRIMNVIDRFEHNGNYRVWSLTGQSYLKLTEATSVDFSGTGKERSSNTKILLIVLL